MRGELKGRKGKARRYDGQNGGRQNKKTSLLRTHCIGFVHLHVRNTRRIKNRNKTDVFTVHTDDYKIKIGDLN